MFDDDASHEILVNGIAAARAKEYDLARHYLEWYLRLDPPLEKRMDALVAMAEIATDPPSRRAYLEEALAIEPGDPRARRLLAVMDGKLDPAQIVDPDRMPAEGPADSPQAADARRFTCPNCGGRMVFTPDGQGLVCEYCATHPPAGSGPGRAAAPDGNFTVAMATARGHVVPVQQHVLTCQGCGAVFILPPQQLTLTCPYCESAHVLAEMETRQLVAPSAVIPFGVDEAAARQALQDWLRSLHSKSPAVVGTVRGLYLPAWSFDVDGQVDFHYRVKVGRNEWTGEEIWEQQDDLSLVDYRDLLIPASTRLPEACRPELAGYDLKGLVPYAEHYLANWPAETYQQTVSDASLDARDTVFKKEQEKARGKLAMQQVRDLAFSSLGIVIEAYKLVLLPAWLAHYTLQEKQYDLMVNGQTGHVTGARPPAGIAGWLDRL
jgi:predicted RNA-binding Zn-ribbon protein involved in translation (DUF1610 family)